MEVFMLSSEKDAENYYDGKEGLEPNLSVIREGNESNRSSMSSVVDSSSIDSNTNVPIDSNGDTSMNVATPPPSHPPPPPPPPPPANFFGQIPTVQLHKVTEMLVKPSRSFERCAPSLEVVQVSNTAKPIHEFANLALDYMNDDHDEDQNEDDLDEDNGESDATSSSGSVTEEVDEHQQNRQTVLWNEFNQLSSTQRQISSLLGSFYRNNSGKTKMLARYGRNIVHAHRCLLLDAVKQNLLQQEMSAKVSQEKEHLIKASLAVQSVGLRLKQCFKSFDNKYQNVCFVLCLVEYGFKVIDSLLLEVPSSSDMLQVNLNLLQEALDPDFEVMLKFYTMSHLVCDKSKQNAVVAMVKRVLRRGYQSSDSCEQLESIESITGAHTFVSFRPIRKVKPATEPLMQSNFTLFGMVPLKRDTLRGCNKNLHRLEMDHFDFCCPFERRVELDVDFKLSFPPDEKFKLGTFTVELVGDQLLLAGSKSKPLEMFEVQLPVMVTQTRVQRRFAAKLVTCLTPLPELDHILLATGRLCLVFRAHHTRVTFQDESPSEDGSIDTEPLFRCILLRSDSLASMAALYRQLATRVEALRQWQPGDTIDKNHHRNNQANNDHERTRLIRLLLTHLRQQQHHHHQ